MNGWNPYNIPVLKPWPVHPAHTSTAITLLALWLSVFSHTEAYFREYSQFSRSWNPNSFVSTSFKWLVLVLRLVTCWELHWIHEKDGWRYLAVTLLTAAHELEDEGEGERKTGMEQEKSYRKRGRKLVIAGRWLLMTLSGMYTVNTAWQTGSKVTGQLQDQSFIPAIFCWGMILFSSW